MQRLAARDDVTVVMATPVPEIVEGLADRVAIIRDGELIQIGTPDELRGLGHESESLAEVLERLISPQTLEHLDAYFEEEAK